MSVSERKNNKIVICGSMSSSKDMETVSKKLQRAGFSVLMPRREVKDVDSLNTEEYHNYTLQVSRQYMKHILYDHDVFAVLVVNPPKYGQKNYIGLSTFSEISVALASDIPIYVLYELPKIYESELKTWVWKSLHGDLSLLSKDYKFYTKGEYSALDVAKYIVNRCLAHNQIVNRMSLSKMLYYCQEVSLGFFDKPLFQDDFLALKPVPQIKSVHEYFYSSSRLIEDVQKEEHFLPREIRVVIDCVVNYLFKCYQHWYQYPSITEPGMPFCEYYDKNSENVIPKDEIRKYFLENTEHRRAIIGTNMVPNSIKNMRKIRN